MSDTLDYVRAIWEADRAAVEEVGRHLERVAEIADAIAERMRRGGRWIYVGAGTSGRLCAADAAEIPPTFGLPPGRVIALVAGGEKALTDAEESAEDDAEAGRKAMRKLRPSREDVAVGVAASGTTPFVLSAIETAREAGALTVAVVCSPGTPLARSADVALQLQTGPEVVAGSTRMKAATAQKIVLTMLSTAVMHALGRVYMGEMVALRPQNTKLRARAVRILSDLAGIDKAEAQRLLEDSKWELPVALVRARFDCSVAEARRRLERHGGSVAAALEDPE